MKKILFFLGAALLALVSCQEWEPVYTFKYEDPAVAQPVTMAPTHTIKELAAMYKTEKPQVITRNIVIAGQVSTTDQPGNFYKTLYIQDETGGIELKIGRNSLYNLYPEGQWIYVRCAGLSLGMYGYKSGNYGGQGMIQLGYADPSGAYETSYIESPLIIDSHVLKGQMGSPVTPDVITEAQLPHKNDTQATNSFIGRLVTFKGLKYAGENFCLLYLDSAKDKTAYTNNVFLSDTNPEGDKTHGITTWGMSKPKMTEYLTSGLWDKAKIGRGTVFTGQTLGDLRGDGSYPEVEKAAYAISQYFTMGKTEVQIRTSGFSKFGDYEIPADVLNGSRAINVTGILTMYQGSIQVTVNSQKDFTYEDGTPLYK